MKLPASVVTFDGQDPITVKPRQADLLLFERTAARHKWPDMAAAPFTFLSFCAWAALHRTGQYTKTWEEFAAEVAEVVPVEDDEVDPTRSDRGTDF